MFHVYTSVYIYIGTTNTQCSQAVNSGVTRWLLNTMLLTGALTSGATIKACSSMSSEKVAGHHIHIHTLMHTFIIAELCLFICTCIYMHGSPILKHRTQRLQTCTRS